MSKVRLSAETAAVVRLRGELYRVVVNQLTRDTYLLRCDAQ